MDVSLVDIVKYDRRQHVNLRGRDEDVYKITTLNKFHRRIHLYKPTKADRLADEVMNILKDTPDSIESLNREIYFLSPSVKLNKIDIPKRGDVIISVHDSRRGWPITSFLVHPSVDISNQCKKGLDWIKQSSS